ncbi:MAG: hypothetical protein JSR85_01875 [Proteobacteria bacterium]|nr:hypothetical protein [Pseudomonadota bacterium]
MNINRFRFTILVSILSGITFFSAPAVSTKNDDAESVRKAPSFKVKAPTTREKSGLKEFLSKQDYPGAFSATKATLPPTVSEEEIVNFLMTSNEYPGWATVDPNDKTWVVAKITNAARRKDLVNFLSKQDYPGAFSATKATLPPTVSDEEIVNFLMTSNNYPGWNAVDLDDKTWVVTKITKAAKRKNLVLIAVDHLAASKATSPAAVPLVQDLLDLSQHHPTKAIKSAAASGELETFKYLLQQARIHGTFSQELLNESLNSAVVGYWLDLRYDEGKLLQIRNVINELLNMNDNGPTQMGVDFAFRMAVSSSANQFSGDLRLLQIMLFDRTTRQLRTGLRPTNEIIKDLREINVFTDKKITEFLKSLNL